ncbi:MAG: bile acid:sodium symporter family protein [Candidatus Omnitrophica bacterium]|nr:bile acid:sodium symporter family protein [Candidatus Omnitrophota bacterium]
MNSVNKFLNWFTQLLVVWVLVAVAVGFFRPGVLTPLKDYVDYLFSFTMLGIGAVLSPRDFIPTFRDPRRVVLGTCAQFIIMPALGFIIAFLLKLPPQLALGLVLAGAVPDAMAAGVMTYLAEADVALSVSLTSLTTFLSPVATPALTFVFAKAFIPVNIWPLLVSVFKMVIIPLLIGLWFRSRFNNQAEKLKFVFPAMSTLFIAFICGLVTALNKNYLIAMSAVIFLAVVLHNLLGLALGYGAGKLFRFDEKSCRTVSIGVGMQNAGLGAVLALKHFSNEAAIPNAIFAVWCIVSAAILARLWKRK